MTALRGRFVMMLIVSLPREVELGGLKAVLAELERRTGLSVQSQLLAPEEARHMPPEPDHMVTVNGADRPGIVFEVAACLADLGISIVDLSTRRGEDGGTPRYMMVLEVAAGKLTTEMCRRLRAVSERLQVDIAAHPITREIL